jgi:hypothetical protein
MNQNNFNNQNYRQNLIQNTNTIMKNNFLNLNPIVVSVKINQYETSVPKENYINNLNSQKVTNKWTDNY